MARLWMTERAARGHLTDNEPSGSLLWLGTWAENSGIRVLDFAPNLWHACENSILNIQRVLFKVDSSSTLSRPESCCILIWVGRRHMTNEQVAPATPDGLSTAFE